MWQKMAPMQHGQQALMHVRWLFVETAANVVRFGSTASLHAQAHVDNGFPSSARSISAGAVIHYLCNVQRSC